MKIEVWGWIGSLRSFVQKGVLNKEAFSPLYGLGLFILQCKLYDSKIRKLADIRKEI